MRRSLEVTRIAVFAVVAVWTLAAAGAAPADADRLATPYKAPIVASLAADEAPSHATSRPSPRARTTRMLDTPGAQLATTAAIFVFATFLAALGSKRS